MENAEKVQDVSTDKVEAPEEVQQEAESQTNKSEETPSEGQNADGEESQPVNDQSENAAEQNPSAEENPKENTVPEVSVNPDSSGEEIVEEEPKKEEITTEESPEEAKVDAEIQSEVQVEEPEMEVKKDENPTDSEADEPKKEQGVEEEPAQEEVSTVEAPKGAKVDAESQTEVQAEESEMEAQKDEHPTDAKVTESEKQEDEEVEEEEDLDFSDATKEDLLKKIKEIDREDRIPRLDRVLKAIKPRFDELYEGERLSALNKFELDGNDPNAFEYQGDEVDKEFDTLYSTLRSKRNRFYKDLEHQKDENLKKKQQLLEQLRKIVDGEESNSSFSSVKEIQTEWKKVGPVPGAHNKTLWANYNALLDRFYDQRSIYFELKDLDRKKNLKVKEELCERAEALADHEDLKSAIIQLNELHEEYKHAGSVPREDQEALWQRFKTASDEVYARRKDYFENLKEEFEKNYVKKLELANVAESFVSFDSDSISEWNKKTKEIQELQKQWEAIGGLPRDKAKSVNKQFWGAFKKFFNHKNQFFKKLEGARDENLKKKEELVLQAEGLKESTDWDGTTQKYKDLQARWKDIGPVPEKVRNEIYQSFKAACDHFFERRRERNAEQNKQYEENLKLKLQICDQIEAIAEKDEINLDDVYDLIDNHVQLGFVPRNAIKKDRARFDEAMEKILSLEDLQQGDKADLKNHIQLSRMKNSPGGDRKIQRKEHSIRRKISELESDINTWNTNMEFFAASATADKLKEDLQRKINDARGELESLKSLLVSINE